MEKISWKSGTRFPVQAQVAADTIKNLQQSLGRDSVTAKELLIASRDENAPLHNCFEWDDCIAAELYRTEQARHLISSIVVEFVQDDKPPVTTRLFVNVQPVTPKQHGEFVTINVALDNDGYRAQVLKNALDELRNFQRKYAAYTELANVFSAVDAFADSLN